MLGSGRKSHARRVQLSVSEPESTVEPVPTIPLSLSVVLVEPRSPGNIGMVARAMANFGVRELRLVRPCDHLAPEARCFAVSALTILEQARVFASLDEATADLHQTVATTRRSGRNREVPLQLEALRANLPSPALARKIGLVFGREDAGLTSDEVARCGLSVTIATDPACGSLNLAQAVILCLYELTRTAPAAVPTHKDAPLQGDWEALFGVMEQVLSRIAFLNPARPDTVMNQLRRIFRRADPDHAELNLLRGMWSQIAWSINDWHGRRRGVPPAKSD